MRILVVGAGFAGSVYARTLAEAGHVVSVIDRRGHVGGNAYDYVDPSGVRIHKYGPHLLHTNNETVVNWLKKFSNFVPYEHSVMVQHGLKYIPMPLSRATFETYYNRYFISDVELSTFLTQIVVPMGGIDNAATYMNSLIGPELTNILFRPYTLKMWGCELDEIDSSVVKRISLQLGYEHRYFPNDRFQLLPQDSYESLFKNILDHHNIKVNLGVSFEHDMRKQYDHVFSSAPIDEYFNYELGELPYRSIKFHHQAVAAPTRNKGHREASGVPTPVVNYSDSSAFTRETHWYMLPQHWISVTDTVIKTIEEPCDYRSNNMERYYPIKDAGGENNKLYVSYKSLADSDKTLSFIGRCGTYQYLDMHQVINQSLVGAYRWIEAHETC